MPNSERQLWELAKSVDGWGRIACVERLSKTTDPEIRDWILRTGYRNSIMTEYLAYIAATTGGLVAALRGADVDRDLLTAAGMITTGCAGPASSPGGLATCCHGTANCARRRPRLRAIRIVSSWVHDSRNGGHSGGQLPAT
jgi:hypothetical protein